VNAARRRQLRQAGHWTASVTLGSLAGMGVYRGGLHIARRLGAYVPPAAMAPLTPAEKVVWLGSDLALGAGAYGAHRFLRAIQRRNRKAA